MKKKYLPLRTQSYAFWIYGLGFQSFQFSQGCIFFCPPPPGDKFDSRREGGIYIKKLKYTPEFLTIFLFTHISIIAIFLWYWTLIVFFIYIY